jgi:hypothetical protein
MDGPKLHRNEQEIFRRWQNLCRIAAEKQERLLEMHQSMSVKDIRFMREDIKATVKKRDKLKQTLINRAKMTWDEILGAVE